MDGSNVGYDCQQVSARKHQVTNQNLARLLDNVSSMVYLVTGESTVYYFL